MLETFYLDTNYLLRYFLRDNLSQYQKAKKLLQKGLNKEVQLVISPITFLEINWVLKSFYKQNKESILRTIQKLSNQTYINIIDRSVVERAIKLFKENNIQLEDCFHLAYIEKEAIDNLATFDKKFSNCKNRIKKS